MDVTIQIPVRMDSAELERRLRVKYGAPEYAFMPQVRNGAGFAANRTADAVTMSVWPSRGLHLIGFEIKISRSDWVRELKNPEKADDVVCYMDHFYVVVSDPKIIQPGELPPTWGLIVPAGVGLKVAVLAPKLEPCALDRSLLASLLRNMNSEAYTSRQFHDYRDALTKKHREELAEREQSIIKNRASDVAELRERIKKFEEASGIEIDRYNAGNIGRAVKFVLGADMDDIPWNIQNAAESFRGVARTIDKAIAEYFPHVKEGKRGN